MKRQFPLRWWAMTVGASLFVGLFLVAKSYWHVRPMVVLGGEFALVCLYCLVRPFTLPLASKPALRLRMLSLAVLPGFFAAAIFISMSPATSVYAWPLLTVGFGLYFGIVRPRARRLTASIGRAGQHRGSK